MYYLFHTAGEALVDLPKEFQRASEGGQWERWRTCGFFGTHQD